MLNIKLFDDRKGVISTLELIAVIMSLFVSFGVFFPGSTYRSNWDDAHALLTGRDIMATLVATGNLHSYMSDNEKMGNFLEELFPETNLIFGYKMEGIKDDILVACNCTNEQISKLYEWANGLRLNDRDIHIAFCYTGLEYPVSSCIKGSDALLIWNNRRLQQHEQMLSNYLVEDKGVVEIVDFTVAEPPDIAQENIFGISDGGNWESNEDEILEPSSSFQITYQPYKFFYNMPLALFGTGKSSDLPECDPCWKGTFTVRDNPHAFWVCNSTWVYFNSLGITPPPDIGPLSPNDTFELEGFNFTLVYVDSENKIKITFSDFPKYTFKGLTPSSFENITPDDDDETRIFARMVGYETNRACGVILNNVSGSRTAWIADFTRAGIDAAGDDHRQLLLSSIVWTSRKYVGSEYMPSLERGHTTSYITVTDIDMFETQKYDMVVGYPY